MKSQSHLLEKTLDEEPSHFDQAGRAARAAHDAKKWSKAAASAAECPLDQAMLDDIAEAREEPALLELVDGWMDSRSPRWLMGWRDICRATDERTVIASVVPRMGVGNKMPLMLFSPRSDKHLYAALLGNLSALAFDYAARRKIGGTTPNYFIYKQLSVLPPDRYSETDLDFLVPRVLELTYTAHDLKPWAEDVGATLVAQGRINPP